MDTAQPRFLSQYQPQSPVRVPAQECRIGIQSHLLNDQLEQALNNIRHYTELVSAHCYHLRILLWQRGNRKTSHKNCREYPRISRGLRRGYHQVSDTLKNIPETIKPDRRQSKRCAMAIGELRILIGRG